jgi:hypothetical protein
VKWAFRTTVARKRKKFVFLALKKKGAKKAATSRITQKNKNKLPGDQGVEATHHKWVHPRWGCFHGSSPGSGAPRCAAGSIHQRSRAGY